ncbi:MAG: uridine diphosphate-N-acetylglucosamine-binding protein YvcK [Nanoarchaeota archaeon]|nr:uridine diphosphate-N-acetylglucosamine-binding protein YvcK [Nanoarchaeota archaeon]
MKRIKAVILDLDDTLYNCSDTLSKNARKRAVSAMISAGLKADPREVYKKTVEISRFPRLDLFAELKKEFNIQDEKIIEAGIHSYNRDEVEDIKPFKGTAKTLESLNSCLLILVTSGVYARQEKKIEMLGIKDKFDYIKIVDGEKGELKRDSFIEIMEKFHLKPSEIVCVGDRITAEIRLGNNLGMTTVQIMKGRFKNLHPKGMEEVPDYKISKISELTDVVKKIDEEDMMNIVAIGGGTGLPLLLGALKPYNHKIIAIVTVTDCGRSSGKIREDFNVLPPGDIRNCLIALSTSEALLHDLFQYRFESGDLEGHSFGNLFLTALTKVTGSFEKSLKETSKLLKLKGKVLPSTLIDTHLCAELEDGRIVEGEVNVRGLNKPPIKRVFLKPHDAKPLTESLEAIKEADIIILGPGSLYTSIIPNLLVNGIAEAIRQSKAKKVFVSNIVTQGGQTDGLKASDHVKAILKYLNKGQDPGESAKPIMRYMKNDVLDCVILNSNGVKTKRMEELNEDGDLVENDIEEIKQLGVNIIISDLIENMNTQRELWNKVYHLRHDPNKIVKIILEYGKNNVRTL